LVEPAVDIHFFKLRDLVQLQSFLPFLIDALPPDGSTPCDHKQATRRFLHKPSEPQIRSV
jgi:hypothetical protein